MNGHTAPADLSAGCRRFEIGELIHLTGLQARADLNGMEGTVVSWLEERGRWVIEMVESAELVRVRAENLRYAPNGRTLDIEPSALRAQFMAVVHKHSLDRGERLEAVTDFVTSADISAAEFAQQFDTSERPVRCHARLPPC